LLNSNNNKRHKTLNKATFFMMLALCTAQRCDGVEFSSADLTKRQSPVSLEVLEKDSLSSISNQVDMLEQHMSRLKKSRENTIKELQESTRKKIKELEESTRKEIKTFENKILELLDLQHRIKADEMKKDCTKYIEYVPVFESDTWGYLIGEEIFKYMHKGAEDEEFNEYKRTLLDTIIKCGDLYSEKEIQQLSSGSLFRAENIALQRLLVLEAQRSPEHRNQHDFTITKQKQEELKKINREKFIQMREQFIEDWFKRTPGEREEMLKKELERQICSYGDQESCYEDEAWTFEELYNALINDRGIDLSPLFQANKSKNIQIFTMPSNCPEFFGGSSTSFHSKEFSNNTEEDPRTKALIYIIKIAKEKLGFGFSESSISEKLINIERRHFNFSIV
jgi:hypothetical protein